MRANRPPRIHRRSLRLVLFYGFVAVGLQSQEIILPELFLSVGGRPDLPQPEEYVDAVEQWGLEPPAFRRIYPLDSPPEPNPPFPKAAPEEIRDDSGRKESVIDADGPQTSSIHGLNTPMRNRTEGYRLVTSISTEVHARRGSFNDALPGNGPAGPIMGLGPDRDIADQWIVGAGAGADFHRWSAAGGFIA